MTFRGNHARFAVLFLTTAATLLEPAVAATAWHVKTWGDDANPGSETSPKRTIQAALTNAADGDTVLVAPGIYLVTNQIAVTNGVAIRSIYGSDFTAIRRDPALEGARPLYTNRIFDLSHSNALVDGFVVSDGLSGDPRGVFEPDHGGNIMLRNGAAIRNCRIFNGVAQGSGGGIALWVNTSTQSLGQIERCIVSNNQAVFYGGGIYIRNHGGTTLPSVTNCLIAGNYADSGGGIYVHGGGVNIAGCTIVKNQAAVADGAGVRWGNLTPLGNGLVSGNIICGNWFFPMSSPAHDNYDTLQTGVPFTPILNSYTRNGWGGMADNPAALTNSPFIDYTNGDYRLRYDSQAVGMGVYPEGRNYVFVSKTGDNTDGRTLARAYNTIQLGVNAATNFQTVLVEPETYVENVNVTGWIKSNLTIKANGRVNLIGGITFGNTFNITVEGMRISVGLNNSQPQANCFAANGSGLNYTLRSNIIENVSRALETIYGNTAILLEYNVFRNVDKTAYINGSANVVLRHNYWEGPATFDTSDTMSNFLMECNTFVGAYGSRVSPNTTPSSNNIVRNNNFILSPWAPWWHRNTGTSIVNATNNWWGSADGPYDPTGITEVAIGDPHPGTANLLNILPAGMLGAFVQDGGTYGAGSSKIDYFPWATNPIPNDAKSFWTGTVAWVDQLYTPGGYNDGHVWEVDAFSNLQDGINAIWSGTVWAAAGTYRMREPVWINKGIAVKSLHGAAQTIVDGGYPSATNRCFYINHPQAVLDGFAIVNGCATRTPFWADGGGVYLNAGLVMNCVVSNNIARNGGGVYIASNPAAIPALRNCLVVSNLATSGGGGICIAGTTGLVENCTVVFNSAVTNGGGIWLNIGKACVENTIVYYNQSADGPNLKKPPAGGMSAGSYIRYSCAPEDLSAYGPGNVSGDPRFQSPATRDFRLMASSSALNTGTNAAWIIPGVTADLDGNIRLRDGCVDMGPYEAHILRGSVLEIE